MTTIIKRGSNARGSMRKQVFSAAFIALLLSISTPAQAEGPVGIGGGSFLYDECEDTNLVGPVLPAGDDSSEVDDVPGVTPTYSTCLKAAGACEVFTTTSTTTTSHGTGFFVNLFYSYRSSTTGSSATTKISCEGTYLFTVTYEGGLGIYQGQSTILTIQTILEGESTKRGPESRSCNFLGSLTECTTAHQGEWGGEVVIKGDEPERLTLCINYRVVVDTDLLKLPYLGTSDYSKSCFNAMKFKIDTQLLADLVAD